MDLFLLEGNMDGLIWLVLGLFFIGFGIPLILAIIGFVQWSKKRKTVAKVLFIIATVYVLISLGVCGSMM
ncbi:MAG: hypothetical protein AAFP76_08270 [Bacteroidota bacterium]